MTQDAADQLADELHARVVMPLVGLLGTDLEPILRDRVEQAVTRLAAELADEETPEPVAIDVLTALWGTADPDPDWWRTPLGRLCARAVADETAESITHARAAAMLGVARGTVATMVHRGTLDRHPDGGVLKSSVLARIASRP